MNYNYSSDLNLSSLMVTSNNGATSSIAYLYGSIKCKCNPNLIRDLT